MGALALTREPKRRVYFRYQYWMPVAYFVHLALTGQHPIPLPVVVPPPTAT